MNKWINYHHLLYFKTIVEEGSVSKAALKLRIGQPTLSSQLKLFEETMGVVLFDRYHKKLVLTEQGKIAFDYAQNIFKLGSEMYEVLHDQVSPNKISLQIGSLDSISKNIILDVTKKALKIAPCQISLLEGNIDYLLRALSSHQIDLALTNFIPTGLSAKGLYPKLIAKKQVSFFGTSNFKHLKKNFPQSIAGQPLILPTYDSRLRFDIEHWANLNKINLNIIVESQDIETKKIIAQEGLGLIVKPQQTVKSEKNDLIEIGGLTDVYEEIYLISAQKKIEHPIAKKILNSFN